MDLQKCISEIDMPRLWTFEKATEIEIKKSIVRANLRYSSAGINFAGEAAKLAAPQWSRSNELLFHTMIYPMIHLAGDKSELGEFHTDQVGRLKLRTSWTAITNYGYDPLRFVPFGLLGNALTQRIFHKSISQRFGFSIKSNQGDTLSWGGGFCHRGNLNQSEDTACAVVTRVTNQPLHLEPSRILEVNSKLTIDIKPLDQSADPFNLVEILKLLYNWAAQLKVDMNRQFLCITIFEFLRQHNCLNQPSISFALSLLAQRIRTKSKIFFQDNIKTEIVSFVLDLMSILSGPENLSSLKNVMNSRITQDYKIIEQIEDLLKGNTVLESKAWPTVTMRNIPIDLPMWKF